MKKAMLRHLVLSALLVMVCACFSLEAGAQTGLVKEDGKDHIYNEKGVLVKNKPAYQVSVEGKKQYYKIDAEGNAVRWTGVEEKAAKRLCLLGAGGKKSNKNLKKAFKWSAGLGYQNLKARKSGKAAYYGTYGFEYGSGDCLVAAYTFYWMAKVLGYPAKAVQGYVPDGSISNLRTHGWVTIKIGGKTKVFDPDFNRAMAGKTVQTRSGVKKLGAYCGYKFTYGTSGTYIYFNKKKKQIK